MANWQNDGVYSGVIHHIEPDTSYTWPLLPSREQAEILQCDYAKKYSKTRIVPIYQNGMWYCVEFYGERR